MPGVVMENGDGNGSHTNHDRDQRPNGINGASHVLEKVLDKEKGKEPQQNITPTSPTGPNALNGMAESQLPPAPERVTIPADVRERMHELPPEILHMTQGYMPLSMLITRFAQKTHNDLSAKIQDLAQMPVPASAVNGNASHAQMDDNSAENVNKKHRLLEFAQNAHADWAKAYVLTSWSRNSEEVGKLIDLKWSLDQQALLYHHATHHMAAVKLDLGGRLEVPGAAIPNPDLKTALQILSTGKAPWMPELNYIQPPPLTAKDLLKTVENLDTLLSIRMNLHEYDKIPWQFKEFEIKSGRVTFKVPGEFEVDLGIVDEDPESQFWFIDLRFLFLPSISELPFGARVFTETRVNAILLKDGLLGCYKYLHEMALTHKITEFKRQAIELAGRKWIDTLKIEPLNRSLSIQYWADRYSNGGPPGLKSWIILGVHSGRRKDSRPDPKATSRLSIRWFRNAKEVKDVDIGFDTVNLSALSLLKTVIAMHVKFILTSIYDKMQLYPVFAKLEAQLSLSTSDSEPAESTLKVQLTNTEHLAISIELITGRFILSPASPIIARGEFGLNNGSRDPASDAHTYIEKLRAMVILDDFISHGLSAGWTRDVGPKLGADDLRAKLGKSYVHVAWLRRASWLPSWFVVLTIGNDGERWFLLETVNYPPNASGTTTSISQSFAMQITGASSVSSYAFFTRLNVFAAALISHCVNLRMLYSRDAHHMLQPVNTSSAIKLPSIIMRLSELLPSKNKSARTSKPWAKDSVRLTFQGLEPAPAEEFVPTAQPSSEAAISELAKAKAKAATSANLTLPPAEAAPPAAQPPPVDGPPVSQLPATESPKQLGPGEGVVVITEARMSVPVPKALTILKEKVDRDIAFDAKSGTFAFRLRSKVGEPVIPAFVERAIRVERLVDFVEVLHRHEKTLTFEYISLGRIIFTYGDLTSPDGMDVDATLKTYKAVVDFGSTDSLMTLIFEQGNPHLRIADNLTRVLNEKQGLDGVATLLPLTLPALQALDTLESAWTPLAGKGEAFVFVHAVDRYIIRYNLTPPSPAEPRKIKFEIRLQHRRGEAWWYIRRTDTRDQDGDDLDAALKPVWNAKGSGWRGMRVSAVAQPAGVGELVAKLDEFMRDFASGNTAAQSAPAAAAEPAPEPTPAQVKPPQRAPEAPMMQQRQQPIPNQSQSQGRNTPQNQGRNTPQSQGRNTPNQSQGQRQGRSNMVKREIVEID